MISEKLPLNNIGVAMSQMISSIQVKLHNSQALIQMINATITYCLWQRAGGKTGGGIGPRVLKLMEVMPRSQVLIFTDTYDRLKKRIIPNVINFLQSKLKLVEGQDFVKYKRPPESFEKPLIPLDDFEHVISFANGFALCLVSLSVEGSANAYNAQAAIGDEVKYCDEDQINSEILPALRGSADLFGNLPEYLSVWMFTDKYEGKGAKVKWLLDKRDKAKSNVTNQRAIAIIYKLQEKIIQLEQQLLLARSESTRQRLREQIAIRKTKADALRKHVVYVSEMKPYENLSAVGEYYLKRAQKLCRSEAMYRTAFLNYDPDKVENCYYSMITEENYYDTMDDINPDKPFIASFDHNWRITPMVLSQIDKLPGRDMDSLNTFDALFVLDPLGIRNVIKQFATKYATHRRKKIYYVYDQTSIGKNSERESYDVIVENTLLDMGWSVVRVYIGQADDHGIRQENFKKYFNADGRLRPMINRHRTLWLQKSVNQAGAITVGSETKKDKRSERDLSFPAAESTHFSEAYDHTVEAVCGRKRIGAETAVSGDGAIAGVL